MCFFLSSRRRHTRLQGDWSSDVCSSDLATIPDDEGTWFGFEQEYFLYKNGAPLGFPQGGGFPPPQGEYYTGVGYKNEIGRASCRESVQIGVTIGSGQDGGTTGRTRELSV